MLHTSWNKTQFHSGKSSWVYWVSSRYATWRSFHWWRSVPASRCTPSSPRQGQSGQTPLGGGRTNGHRSRSGAGTPPCGSPGNEVVWWRHETLPTLLVLCAGKPPPTNGFTHKRTVRRFDVCFVTSLNKCWANSRVAGDLSCHGAHVTSLHRYVIKQGLTPFLTHFTQRVSNTSS